MKKGFRFSFAGGVMLFLLLELPKLSLSSANVLSKPFWSISTPAKRYKHVNHMSVIISFNNVNKCINNRIMLFVSRHRLCSAEEKTSVSYYHATNYMAIRSHTAVVQKLWFLNVSLLYFALVKTTVFTLKLPQVYTTLTLCCKCRKAIIADQNSSIVSIVPWRLSQFLFILWLWFYLKIHLLTSNLYHLVSCCWLVRVSLFIDLGFP